MNITDLLEIAFMLYTKFCVEIIDNVLFRGGYAKPSWQNVLWGWLLLAPLWLIRYIIWYIKWIWKFNILQHEYGTEEKCYIIRKRLGKSAGEWDVSTFL